MTHIEHLSTDMREIGIHRNVDGEVELVFRVNTALPGAENIPYESTWALPTVEIHSAPALIEPDIFEPLVVGTTEGD